MTNEELTIMANLISEVQNLRKESKACYRDMMDARTESGNAKRELTALKEECSTLREWNSKRDEALRDRIMTQNKINALAETLNMLIVDVDKLKRPREFLRDFKAAVEKCIIDNNIAIRHLEDEA